MKTVTLTVILVLSFFSFILPTGSSAERLQATAQQDKQKGRGEKEKGESESKVSGELGAKSNPVRCSGPRGERAYLSRLRCADGKAPKFYRIGSFGEGPYGNILDGYSVKCEEGDEATIFMDMYHDHVEREAVPGFRIINEEQKSVATRAPDESLKLIAR